MGEQRAASRMVTAADFRDWLLWVAAHYDPQRDTPENTELRRLGRTLEALGRTAGAIGSRCTTATVGGGVCLLATFDWEHGAIEICQPYLLTNRLGSPDPEALISRLVAVTGLAEHRPEEPPEPEYVV